MIIFHQIKNEKGFISHVPAAAPVAPHGHAVRAGVTSMSDGARYARPKPDAETAMPRTSRALVGTLAHLMQSGREVALHCGSCHHRTTADLLAQIEAHGEAYRLQSFIDRAVCSKCRARWPKLDVTVMPVRKRG